MDYSQGHGSLKCVAKGDVTVVGLEGQEWSKQTQNVVGTRWYTVVISILSVTGQFCRSSENQNNPHEQKIGSSREVSYRKKSSAENWATNTYITFRQRL